MRRLLLTYPFYRNCTYVNLCMLFAISMYTLSFADYFLALFPGVNGRLIGCIALTFLFAMHLTGVKQAARLQNVLSVVFGPGHRRVHCLWRWQHLPGLL